jgi:hypothetical protein
VLSRTRGGHARGPPQRFDDVRAGLSLPDGDSGRIDLTSDRYARVDRSRTAALGRHYLQATFVLSCPDLQCCLLDCTARVLSGLAAGGGCRSVELDMDGEVGDSLGAELLAGVDVLGDEAFEAEGFGAEGVVWARATAPFNKRHTANGAETLIKPPVRLSEGTL